MGKLIGIARRDRKRAPMQELDSAAIHVETGVALDSRGKPGKRQVTVLSARVWHEVCSELGADIPWTTRRANLLVKDIDLPTRMEGLLRIGEVQLQINAETDPCSRMDEQCPGLRDALKPDRRGGVSCSVIKGGAVKIGDPVSFVTVD